MTDFPSGTVTFLFTDIEGSTRLAQQYPVAIPALLARHDEILNQAIHSHDGHIFQTAEDAFCAAFSLAIDAANAALDAQRLLDNEAWSPAPIRVRMGVHTGLAQAGSDGQYSGYATLALAQTYYEDCLAWAERVASSISVGYAKVRLGYLFLRCGELQKASHFFYEALRLFRKAENLYGINFTLEGLASLAVAEQRWQDAAILFSYTEGQYQGPRPPVERATVDRDLAAIRNHLTDEEFKNLSDEGGRRTMEQAINLITEE